MLTTIHCSAKPKSIKDSEEYMWDHSVKIVGQLGG